MSWSKSPPALVATFDAALPHDASIERRKMFGYPAAFVGGNMVASLFEEKVVIRLGNEARQALRVAGGMPFEPMPGRAMKEYTVAPSGIAADKRALGTWLERAVAFGKTLPAKGAAPAKKRARPAPKKPAAKRR